LDLGSDQKGLFAENPYIKQKKFGDVDPKIATSQKARESGCMHVETNLCYNKIVTIFLQFGTGNQRIEMHKELFYGFYMD